MERYKIDHDFHIHSQLSTCSSDPEQTTARILQYAEENGFTDICLTDHFWDETVSGASEWYQKQDYAHITQALPLPQGAKTRFHFGCEIDMDKFRRIGLAEKHFDRFEFVIIPTTHLHMTGFTIDESDLSLERRAVVYVERLKALMRMDLPFEKIGVAHLTVSLMAKGEFTDHLTVLDSIPDGVFEEMFGTIAEKKAGFELNFAIHRYEGENLERVLRPYRIAKKCGCRFYLGSDAHHPAQLDAARTKFERIVDALALTEDEKFRVFR